eukprot:TRINITY_DN29903_c0_g1_i1.p1 TRINITY_DN29903_c0_g1~~TRINITY_DN29903_c0_g1_i1.p1  ORF type:complete len:370 (-),score=16.87 TRINITY_DN29903_c0_g1_i1:316-1425(-)
MASMSYPFILFLMLPSCGTIRQVGSNLTRAGATMPQIYKLWKTLVRCDSDDPSHCKWVALQGCTHPKQVICIKETFSCRCNDEIELATMRKSLEGAQIPAHAFNEVLFELRKADWDADGKLSKEEFDQATNNIVTALSSDASRRRCCCENGKNTDPPEHICVHPNLFDVHTVSLNVELEDYAPVHQSSLPISRTGSRCYMPVESETWKKSMYYLGEASNWTLASEGQVLKLRDSLYIDVGEQQWQSVCVDEVWSSRFYDEARAVGVKGGKVNRVTEKRCKENMECKQEARVDICGWAKSSGRRLYALLGKVGTCNRNLGLGGYCPSGTFHATPGLFKDALKAVSSQLHTMDKRQRIVAPNVCDCGNVCE